MNKLSLYCLLAIVATTAAFTPTVYTPLAEYAKTHRIPQSSPSNIQSLMVFPAKSSTRRNRSTRMNMMAPAAGAAALMGVVSGGILGGALHAIAGEFH